MGTLFAALTAHLRARELLFPVLLLPVAVPVLLATVARRRSCWRAAAGARRAWRRLLVGADLVYLVTGLLTFEFVLEA